MTDYPVEPRPEPVMNAAYVAGLGISLVKILLLILASFGVWDTTSEQQNLLVAGATIVADMLIVVWTMRARARPQVTPLESPMDATGTALIRATDGQSAVTTQEAKAAQR